MKNLTIIAATGNKNKLKEFKEIFESYGFAVEMKSAAECGICDFPEENENTFIGNALIKARFMHQNVIHSENTVVIADDSGLTVDALDGAPGVHTARYAGENASDDDKMNKLLSALEGIPDSERTAAFVCSIAAILPDGTEVCTDGYMKGRIAFVKKGTNGFGYDPIMYIPEYCMNVAELTSEQKNEISHRGKALRAMADKLNSIFGGK